MKIMVVSDLHIDNNAKPLMVAKSVDFLETFCQYIKDKSPDIVLITGDLSSYYRTTIHLVESIQKETGIKIYFVPGNHDVWTKYDSWYAYNQLASHPQCLSGEILELKNQYVVVGDMFWYDYSFDIHGFSKTTLANKMYGSTVWMDKYFVTWKETDEEVTQYFLRKVERILEKCADKKVIFMSHMVPFIELVKIKDGDLNWNYVNSFIGSKKIGELILKYPNIEYVFCGHTHFRGQLQKGNTKVICNPLGYVHANEWVHHFDLIKELDEVAYLFEI